MSIRGKYFVISDTDQAWGLHILDCGSSMIRSGDEFSSLNHPRPYQLDWERGRVLREYQIFYLYKGMGVFESVESGTMKLGAGSMIFIYPGIWHRYRPDPDSQWYTYWIGFDGDIAHRLIENFQISINQPVLDIGYHEKLINIFMNIMDVGQMEFTGYQQVMAGDLFRLFGWLRSFQQQQELGGHDSDSIIQEAKTIMMRENLNINIEQVADELNIGYSKFRKLFKDYTGLAPGQYMVHMRISRASQLLSEGKMTVREISDQLGFESPQYFSRIFKKKTGQAPGYFRKSTLTKGN